MSKKVIKPIVLIVVFIAALITFCITTNKGNKDMTTKQADATLPVMSFNLDKIKINTLHGYTTEMDPTKMRDCVIPISDDRKLSLSISTYGMAVDRISYKIRSMDGKRLVADDEISSFSNKDNTIQADVNMPNVMDEILSIFWCLPSQAVRIMYIITAGLCRPMERQLQRLLSLQRSFMMRRL